MIFQIYGFSNSFNFSIKIKNTQINKIVCFWLRFFIAGLLHSKSTSSLKLRARSSQWRIQEVPPKADTWLVDFFTKCCNSGGFYSVTGLLRSSQWQRHFFPQLAGDSRSNAFYTSDSTENGDFSKSSSNKIFLPSFSSSIFENFISSMAKIVFFIPFFSFSTTSILSQNATSSSSVKAIILLTKEVIARVREKGFHTDFSSLSPLIFPIPDMIHWTQFERFFLSSGKFRMDRVFFPDILIYCIIG